MSVIPGSKGAAASTMPLPDYDRFLTATAKRRLPGMHAMAKLLRVPGMVNLAGGLPNASAFPFQSFSFTTDAGDVVSFSQAETQQALQYSETEGLPPLVEWCRAHQQRMHSPPYDDYSICVSTGSQDALVRCFEAMLNEGDHVVLEKYTYAAALSALRPMAPVMHAMDVDEHGMRPESLRELLEGWPEGTPKPKFIYLVPVGQNPLGHVMPTDRKRALYSLASQHDILIIEDDPYFHLTLDPIESRDGESRDVALVPPPSFFSMDVDRRVVRLDSFSKTLSAGLRLGWISGPKEIVERVILHIQVSSLQPCGLSQTVLYKMLHQWGTSGYDNHVALAQRLYRSQRDLCLAAVRRHLGHVATFNTPQAGMFLWITLPDHVDTSVLFDRLVANSVAVAPGKMFAVDGKPCGHVRVSYSQATAEMMEAAFKEMAVVVKEMIGEKK